MIFNSLAFIVFIILFFTVYSSLKKRARLYFVLFASYFFYGWWDYRYLSLIILSTLIDYCVGIKIFHEQDSRKRKNLLQISITANLLILFAFKYFNFFYSSFQSAFSVLGFQINPFSLKVLLPVGISFYTFQSMSYTIDVYRRKIDCEEDFICFASFVAFFPQLVAGPIERAARLLPQIKNLKGPTRQQVKEAAFLILWGYFLKVFIADNIARTTDYYFSVGSASFLSAPQIAVGMLSFALQIYGDFAGYSKIARGIAKLFGVELMMNFNHPYLAKNPSDFWRRWHISLSTWLKDYLYIPLGGNRKGVARNYSNLMVTMLLGGLWHGASWTFVIWGGYQGLLLVFYRWYSSVKHNSWLKAIRIPDGCAFLLMFVFCLYGWLIFRCESLGQLRDFSLRLFSDFSLPFGTSLKYFIIDVFWLCLFYGIVWGVDIIQEEKGSEFLLRFNRKRDYVIAGGMIFLMVMFGGRSEAFIYFQF